MRSLVCVLAFAASVAFAAETRFEISYPPAVTPGPITGRVFVIITRSLTVQPQQGGAATQREPRQQVGRVGVPFFGRDVEKLGPGQAAVIDATDLGTPVESLAEIPAGDYYVQAFVNIYSEFHRSDGHVVWMHDDRWEGQHWNSSPGNLFSTPKQIHLDAAAGYRIPLVSDQVIP
jgi:hypothetical protein